MTKKRGLGKGLGALIPPTPKPVSPEVQAGAIEVPVDQISPNPHQPRHTIHEDKLQDLANSIAEHGLIQPLIVTRVGATYQLIAGERRWRACQLAGITTVPVMISRNVNFNPVHIFRLPYITSKYPMQRYIKKIVPCNT